MLALAPKPSLATVLVVDDDPFVRVVVADALTEAGYSTVEADNAEAALDLLNDDPNIDVLITDLHLPGALNGRQLALEAYSLFPELKVVFITGDGPEASKLEKLPGTADGVLVKPFRLDDLWHMVSGLLEVAA